MNFREVIGGLVDAYGVAVERMEGDVQGGTMFSLSIGPLRGGFSTGFGTRVVSLHAREGTRVEWHLSLPNGRDPLSGMDAVRTASRDATQKWNLPAQVLSNFIETGVSVEEVAPGVSRVHVIKSASDAKRDFHVVRDMERECDLVVSKRDGDTIDAVAMRIGAMSMSVGAGWTQRGEHGRTEQLSGSEVMFCSTRATKDLNPEHDRAGFARGLARGDQRMTIKRDASFDPFEFKLAV